MNNKITSTIQNCRFVMENILLSFNSKIISLFKKVYR